MAAMIPKLAISAMPVLIATLAMHLMPAMMAMVSAFDGWWVW